MKEFLVVGVDISKSTLDSSFKPMNVSLRVQNDTKGHKQWLSELNRICRSGFTVMVVMEHTGQYSYCFERFLRKKGIGYCKVAALQIKRSLGIVRGKTDKVDADRIAQYGWLRRDVLVADEAMNETIRRLRSLLGLRAKLVRSRSGYISRFKEMKAAATCTASCFEGKVQQRLVDVLTKEIRKVDAEIRAIVNNDESLRQNCQLLRSIKGVGWIIACYMIGCTENFSRFTNPRKFNCYAGLAPFKHESGSSIRARASVSHLANKTAKTLLNLGAYCAIRNNQELRAYYQKRIQEGKSKMSCINIIRSKLVARMFAIVKRQTPYQLAAA